MPILARHRWLHPIDRRELSLSVRFRRACGRRERCGRPHGRDVLHLGDGRWWDEDVARWRCGRGKRLRRMLPPHSTVLPTRRTRVVLSTCHLDHDPQNDAASNLAALRQRCHPMNDALEHRRRRAATVRARRACGDLFEGPYGRSRGRPRDSASHVGAGRCTEASATEH